MVESGLAYSEQGSIETAACIDDESVVKAVQVFWITHGDAITIVREVRAAHFQQVSASKFERNAAIAVKVTFGDKQPRLIPSAEIP